MPNVGVTQPILQLHRNKYLELENEVVLSNQSNASESVSFCRGSRVEGNMSRVEGRGRG